MISIKKASEDLDRLAGMVKAAKASYSHAVWSASQYVVELDAADSKQFREHLDRIRTLADRTEHPEDWVSVQASFRGELRDYRDRSLARLNKLRNDLRAAAEAMETFAVGVASSGAGYKEEVNSAMGKLDAAVETDSLQVVRTTLTETKNQIRASVERMEQQHQLAIAQLRDEIRSLHAQIDAEHRVPFLDVPSGVWNRDRIQSQMEEMLNRDESFCVLVLRLHPMRRLDRCSPALIDGGIRALTQRLAAMLGPDAFVGRWEEDVFLAIVQNEPAPVISLSREAASRLSGAYSVQEEGASRRIELKAATGVIERKRGMSSAALHLKLQQMAGALAGS